MICPKCKGVTTVKETSADSSTVYRGRKCGKCGYYFFTTETLADDDAKKMLRHLRYMKR